MRLTCPNCGAQYEVPDGVIPPEGRDVQCSNCGNTWFQDDPAQAGPEIAPVTDEIDQPVSSPDEPEPAADDPVSAEVSDPYDDQDDWPEEAADEPDDDYTEEPATSGTARGLDPMVSDILREEAAREAQLRSGEMTGGLESQPELGLDEVADDEHTRRARQARERMAMIKGEPVNPPPAEPEPQGSRRGLLPDIDEINSTLRSSEGGADAPALADELPVPPPRKTGFARGFALMLILAVALGVIYVKAPEIARAVPQADPMLSAYVALVDQARVWLDATVAGLRG